LENFHPKWDGFMQLRIYLGAPNHQAYEIHYPALNLEITGDTWTAVGGGPVDCKAGTAVSDESVLLPSLQSTTVPSTAAASGHSTSGTSARSATTPTAAPGVSSEEKGAASQSSQGQETVGAKAGGSKASSSDVSLLGGIAVGALVVLGLIFLFLRKRRTDGVRA
jgi:cobalamin biosynthesis Mg chelatase CobN